MKKEYLKGYPTFKRKKKISFVLLDSDGSSTEFFPYAHKAHTHTHHACTHTYIHTQDLMPHLTVMFSWQC